MNLGPETEFVYFPIQQLNKKYIRDKPINHYFDLCNKMRLNMEQMTPPERANKKRGRRLQNSNN
jgi:hypothetical protein